MANIIGIEDFGISDTELRSQVAELKTLIEAMNAKLDKLISDVNNIKNNQGSGGSSGGTSPGNGTVLNPDESGAYIVDDFSSGSLDNNKWTHEKGYVRNNETQRYTDDGSNSYISDNMLVIKAIKASDGSWTSASVISHGRFAFMYGRIEARIKFCNYNGSFPAFWTLGDSFEFGYKDWSAPDTLGEDWAWCGELDICEFYGGRFTAGIFVNANEGLGRVYCPEIDTNQWHVFAMEWKEDGSLYFFMDDKMVTSTGATDNTALHIPHYILLNQAVGSSGGTPDAGTTEMVTYVDYVKYYPLSSENIKQNSEDFELVPSNFNWNKCDIRVKFNDNCLNKAIIWSSSNETVISVHAGHCVGHGTGSAIITGRSFSGVTKTVELKVNNDQLSQ